ncbi:MAG: transcription termination/antitermination NusG family protein [Ginsengibacter sp.]
MQKNWYVVYTKQHSERKVSLLLSKKGIENFCPLNYKKSRSLFWKTITFEPVFDSYVFVKADDAEILNLSKQITDIISLLYWKGKPATIREEEIYSIKEFTTNYTDISLEKISAHQNSDVKDDVSYIMDGQVLTVKNKAMKVNLPSLGFTMVANIPEHQVMGRSISFTNNELIAQS